MLIPLLTSSVGLLVLLMYFPGGLVQIGYSARDALFALARPPAPRGGRGAETDRGAARARVERHDGRRTRSATCSRRTA